MIKRIDKRALWAMLLILVAGLLYVLLGGPTPWSSHPVETVTAPVVVEAARIQDMGVNVDNVGSVESPNNVMIKSRVDGQILTANFKQGAHVRKGDLLFKLDPRTFEASLRIAEASLLRDRAQLVNAESNLKRYADLSARGFATGQQYDQSKSDAAALRATVLSDKAAVDMAKLQLEYTDIRAPFAGVAGAQLLNPGNNVKANDLPLVVINQLQPIYVTFAVPEQYLPQISKSFKQGPLAVTVTLPGDSGPPIAGKLFFIDNAIDTSTGTLRLKAKFSNEDGRLLPGLFVNVDLVVAKVPHAITTPIQAIQTGQSGAYVYVVGKDMKAELRNVTTGVSDKGRVVVASGLKAGEQVVIDGQLRLAPGMPVTVMAAPSATDAALSKPTGTD